MNRTLSLVCLALFACTEPVGVVEVSSGEIEDVKVKVVFRATPNPVTAHTEFVLSGSGFFASQPVRIDASEPACCTTFEVMADAAGSFSLARAAGAPALWNYKAFQRVNRRDVMLAEVVVEVSGGCGDGLCMTGETCTSCSADCGACAPVCGNGTCESGETCTSCGADCGACGPVCGNGTCESGETCASCVADCGACVPTGTVDIWVPRTHNPQFVMPDGSFEVELRAASSLAAGGWTATLRNEQRGWPCTVSAATYSTINHASEPGWRLTIRVPASVSPELFDLELAHAAGGRATADRGVQVVEDFEESFYVLHQTDQHVTDLTATNANGTKQNGSYQNGSVDGMKWGAKSINLINPRFVVMTGDNTQIYNSATSWAGLTGGAARLELYKQGLAAYRTATLAVTGNHDIGYSDYVDNAAWESTYLSTLGQRAFSYRLGSFYVLLSEWTQPDFESWAISDYASAYADSSLKFRLLATHFSDYRQIATAANPAHMKVVGHNHTTSVVQTTPYKALSAPSAQYYQQSAVYEFNRTAAGWSCPQLTTHADGVNVFPMHGDWGAAKVAESWLEANDGTQTTNSVTVANSLPFNFWHGRVKFLLAKGSYTVTGGTIEASYDDETGRKTALVVRVNIPASGSVTVSAAASTPPPPPPAAKWGSVPIGGGGYVTGIFAHPLEQNLLYLKTDIGGAYRYEAAGNSWRSLTDGLSIDQRHGAGVASLGLDPKDANTLYLAGGRSLTWNGAVLKSTDKGAHWTPLSLTIPIDGNADKRWSGERLAVSPRDGRIVLFGTQVSGLQRSADAGATWTKVGTMIGTSPFGVMAVSFDPRANNVVYAAAWGEGVYRSSDEGATWSLIAGSPTKVLRLQVAADGAVYTTGEDAGRGVARYEGSSFVGIEPAAATPGGYAALALNPKNSQDLLVMTADVTATKIYRSTSRGATWTQKTVSAPPTVPWWPTNFFAQHAASALFDPHVAGRVWQTDWFGIWKTDDINAQPSVWASVEKGHEEVVTFALAAPASGPLLLSGLADVEGFDHPVDLVTYPSRRLGGFQDTYGFAWCQSQPARMVRVGGTRWNSTNGAQVSSDGGATWTALSAWPSAKNPRKVAMSATRPETFIVSVSLDKPLRTTDGGATFNPVATLPNGPQGPWNNVHNLIADRVDGDGFYYLDCATGKFYRSSDGGATFANTFTLGTCDWTCSMRAGDAAGEIWVSLDKKGLWRSTDAGSTFSQVSSVTRAWQFALGKAPSGSTRRALYLQGAPTGKSEGIYRSVDGGASWTSLGDPAFPVSAAGGDMAASEREYGLLFVGAGGRGIFFRRE